MSSNTTLLTSARGRFIGHDDFCPACLLASPLGFPQQSPSSLSVIYKREPLALLSIHCDTRYRVLVSQIDSNENVFRHVGLVSFLDLAFFYLEPIPRLGLFFYIVNSSVRPR